MRKGTALIWVGCAIAAISMSAGFTPGFVIGVVIAGISTLLEWIQSFAYLTRSKPARRRKGSKS